jgi:hypothetical protein
VLRIGAREQTPTPRRRREAHRGQTIDETFIITNG